jgi:chromosome segregation ATPase
MTDSNLARQFAKQAIRKAKKIPTAKKAPSETAKKLGELKRLESRDKTHIIILQNKIKELEGELNRKNRARKQEDEINEERIETVSTELNTLKDRIKQQGIDIQKPSEKRVEAIEKVAKAKAAYVEIMKLEDKLKKMEARYENLKSQRKYSEESLEVIKLAIEALRDKISIKKFDLEKEKELKPRHVVRHTMKFGMPAPKKPIPAEEGKIKLPPLPGEPDLTMPKPPKKSIFKRLLFGK